APAAYLALPAGLIVVPAGVLATLGLYGPGVKEQLSGLLLLIWGLLGTIGAVTLWAVVLQPNRRSLGRACGLIGGILAMLFFVYFFGFDVGTLPLTLGTAWAAGGPIVVAGLFLACWARQWLSDRQGTRKRPLGG